MPPLRLRPNEVEAANRAEATALLIRAGYRIYRPEADCDGEDLVVRTPANKLRVVQLKSRPTVDRRRYGGRVIWMLFPDPTGGPGRAWYLAPHERLYSWFKRRHGQAPKWDGQWHAPRLSRELSSFLRRYRLRGTEGRET